MTILPHVELLRGRRACARDRKVHLHPEGPHPKCVQCPPIQEPTTGAAGTSPQELHPLAECIPSRRWGVQCTFPAFPPYRLRVVI